MFKSPRLCWSSGSEAERIAVETACSYGSKAEAFSAPTAEDVTITVALDGEGPFMGQDAELSIVLRNSSSQQRTLDLHSQASVMYYTGVHKATVRRDRTDVDILPNEGERHRALRPSAKSYLAPPPKLDI